MTQVRPCPSTQWRPILSNLGLELPLLRKKQSGEKALMKLPRWSNRRYWLSSVEKNHTKFRYSPNFPWCLFHPKYLLLSASKMLRKRIKSNLLLSSCIFSGGDSLSFLLYRRGKKNNYQTFTVEMCTMRSISVPISFHHYLLSLSIEISEKNPTGFETSSTWKVFSSENIQYRLRAGDSVCF